MPGGLRNRLGIWRLLCRRSGNTSGTFVSYTKSRRGGGGVLTEFTRFPMMRGRRRPSLSMKRTQHASPRRPMMLFIAWYFNASVATIPTDL